MEPVFDEYRPVNWTNAASAVVDIPSGNLMPLYAYFNNGGVNVERSDEQTYQTLVHGGACTGKLLVVMTRLPGKTPTVRGSEATKLKANGGSAFHIGVPKGKQYPNVHGNVAALLLTALHVVDGNRANLEYDTTAIYFTPEADANFDAFDVHAPQHYLGGRLYECKTVARGADFPTFSGINFASHEVKGDAAVLAVLEACVNEEVLLDVIMPDNRSLAESSSRIGEACMVPNISAFVRDDSSAVKIAAIGYPGPDQRCVPQDDATDFNEKLKWNPLRLDRLQLYFLQGTRRVASVGRIEGERSAAAVFKNNGYSAAVSTGAGMSGGPVIPLEQKGFFHGIIVGSATTSNKLYLVDDLFHALDQDPVDEKELERIHEQLLPVRLYPKLFQLQTSNLYLRRQVVLALCDDIVGKLKSQTEGTFTIDKLNHNHTLPVCGPTIAELYRTAILPFLDESLLLPEQKLALTVYKKWLSDNP